MHIYVILLNVIFNIHIYLILIIDNVSFISVNTYHLLIYDFVLLCNYPHIAILLMDLFEFKDGFLGEIYGKIY